MNAMERNSLATEIHTNGDRCDAPIPDATRRPRMPVGIPQPKPSSWPRVANTPTKAHGDLDEMYSTRALNIIFLESAQSSNLNEVEDQLIEMIDRKSYGLVDPEDSDCYIDGEARAPIVHSTRRHISPRVA